MFKALSANKMADVNILGKVSPLHCKRCHLERVNEVKPIVMSELAAVLGGEALFDVHF